jgi:WD40 repeat protein
MTATPDGRFLVTSDNDGKNRIWDLVKGEVARELALPSRPTSFFFADQGDLISGHVNGVLERHHFSDGKMVQKYRGYPDRGKVGSRTIGSLRVGSKPGTFVTCNFSGDVAVWNTDRTEPISEFSSAPEFQNAYPVPQGYLLSGYGTESVRLVDSTGNKIWEEYASAGGGPVCVAHDGSYFIRRQGTQIIEVSIATRAEQAKYECEAWVDWIEATPDGRYLICQNQAYTMMVWDRQTGKIVYTAKLPILPDRRVVSNDGRFLFLADEMGWTKKPNPPEIYVWRLPK